MNAGEGRRRQDIDISPTTQTEVNRFTVGGAVTGDLIKNGKCSGNNNVVDDRAG